MYNTGTLINRCLEAILTQDYEGPYEVVVVDDGSTDDSYTIAATHRSDARLRLLQKVNGGPASARNFGLENISSDADWVTFIDSDDYVEPDFLSTLAGLNADLRIATPFPTYGEWSSEHYAPRQVMKFADVLNNPQFAKYLKCGVSLPFWNKLFSVDIIRENNLRIKDVRLLEDADFVVRYMEYCNSVEWINHKVYNYIKRPGSETSRLEESMIENYYCFHEQLLAKFNPSLTGDIDEFIYPQYLALVRRWVRNRQYTFARQILKRPLVKRSFTSHKCVTINERIFNFLMRNGFVKTAKSLYER